LCPNVGNAAFDFREPLTVLRTSKRDGCARERSEARFPLDTIEPHILFLRVFRDALTGHKAAAMGGGQFRRYTRHV
jgi:hypothetical protein